MAGAEGFEILGWGLSAKSVVGSPMIEAMGEGVDEGLQFVDAMGQVPCGVEFVAPG